MFGESVFWKLLSFPWEKVQMTWLRNILYFSGVTGIWGYHQTSKNILDWVGSPKIQNNTQFFPPIRFSGTF